MSLFRVGTSSTSQWRNSYGTERSQVHEFHRASKGNDATASGTILWLRRSSSAKSKKYNYPFTVYKISAPLRKPDGIGLRKRRLPLNGKSLRRKRPLAPRLPLRGGDRAALERKIPAKGNEGAPAAACTRAPKSGPSRICLLLAERRRRQMQMQMRPQRKGSASERGGLLTTAASDGVRSKRKKKAELQEVGMFCASRVACPCVCVGTLS